jgi:hypothetical protein
LSSRAVCKNGEAFIVAAMTLDEETQVEIRQMIEPIFEPGRLLEDTEISRILVTKLGKAVFLYSLFS